MTTINPNNGAGADRLNPTIQSTLSRLGRALTIRDGKAGPGAAARAGDSVEISPSASSASSSLDRVGSLLAGLESLVAQAAADDSSAEVRAEAQRRIDEAVAQISQVAGSGSVGAVGDRLNAAPGYSVVNRHDAISGVAVSSDLKQGERLDVELNVLHSAHFGGFFLSLGGISIDLGTGSSFVFEIAGNFGSQILSFFSGTTIYDIEAAINTFEDQTGVHAVASQTGIRIESVGLSADDFVTIRVLDDGSVAGSDGILTLRNDDPTAASPFGATQFGSSAANAGLTDFGRDFEAEINGVAAQVDGNRFSASLLGGRVDVAFDFDPISSLNNWAFPIGTPARALTVLGGHADPSFDSDRSDQAENIRVENRALGRGESFDVIFDTFESAKRAGVYLQLGGFGHATTVAGELTFTLQGPTGAESFVLHSGQSIASVLDAINAKSEQLGTQARLSGKTLLIATDEFGESQHISLKIDAADFYQGAAGRLLVDYHGSPIAEHTDLTINDLMYRPAIKDSGQDIHVYSNFHHGAIQFSTDGRRIVGDVFDGDLHFELDLATILPDPEGLGYGTPRLDNFHAFTIHGADGVNVDGPIGDIPAPAPLPASSPLLDALAPFATGGASAGDFDAALGAIRLLRDQAAPPVSEGELQQVRSELIAEAGRSLGITAPTDAERALELLGGAKSTRNS